MALDPALAQRAEAYARVFGENADTLAVLDDLLAFAQSQPDPLVKAGIALAVHRCYLLRSLSRRQARKR